MGWDLDFGRIDGKGVASEGVRGVGDGGEGRDNFGGGLNAAEEGGDEDAVEREREVVAKDLTGFECPKTALLNERWVPGAGGGGDPGMVEVVDAIAVSHYDDVLVKLRSGLHLMRD